MPRWKATHTRIHMISSREGLDLNISEDMLNQLDKSAQTAYERFYGVKKSAKQTVEQLAETTVLTDSAKAVADSLKAVNDSIIKNAVNKKDFEYVHQAGPSRLSAAHS